ncbi:hypothetical protein D3C85_938610 [compost metagenome]
MPDSVPIQNSWPATCLMSRTNMGVLSLFSLSRSLDCSVIGLNNLIPWLVVPINSSPLVVSAILATQPYSGFLSLPLMLKLWKLLRCGLYFSTVPRPVLIQMLPFLSTATDEASNGALVVKAVVTLFFLL